MKKTATTSFLMPLQLELEHQKLFPVSYGFLFIPIEISVVGCQSSE